MLAQIGLLILGLAVLTWSADRFVYGAAALARNLGIAPMIIGLTIVAMGSSAPEIVVSTVASLQGKPDTAVGNAVGSNITNVCLVLGMTALFRPLLVGSTTLRRELPILVGVTLFGGWVLHDNHLSFGEGIALVSGFFVVIGFLLWSALKDPAHSDAMVEESISEVPDEVPTSKALIWLVVGLILLPISAHILVEAAVYIAKFFGLSDLVIGLTIIAIGTSLPELAASIAGVLKGEDDLALGNVIGSNIFNLLAVMGIPGLLAAGPIDPSAADRDFWYMLGTTIAVFVMAMSWRGRQRRINRFEGALLLLAFVAYQYLLFYNVAS